MLVVLAWLASLPAGWLIEHGRREAAASRRQRCGCLSVRPLQQELQLPVQQPEALQYPTSVGEKQTFCAVLLGEKGYCAHLYIEHVRLASYRQSAGIAGCLAFCYTAGLAAG